MSVPAQAFHDPHPDGWFTATAATAGPWSAQAQHGGPPAGLLGRAVEELEPDRVVGRFAMDLLGPVPVGRVGVSAEVVRPGRSVSLCRAELTDEDGRVCARAHAWLFPASQDGPGPVGPPLGHGPDDGELQDLPPGWGRGYLDAVEWRWIEGSIATPGPATVWMRPLVPLVAGEATSPLQRLLTCVDSASGVSAEVDIREWTFLNTELTVHVTRPVAGEWVCVRARTRLGPGSTGLAESEVYDERGFVGRSAQALLVARR